jgi:hypothetical protein
MAPQKEAWEAVVTEIETALRKGGYFFDRNVKRDTGLTSEYRVHLTAGRKATAPAR